MARERMNWEQWDKQKRLIREKDKTQEIVIPGVDRKVMEWKKGMIAIFGKAKTVRIAVLECGHEKYITSAAPLDSVRCMKCIPT